MRVITVINRNDAKNLLKLREIESNQTVDYFSKNLLDVVHGYSSDNTGYDNTPMIGLATIDNETADLEKHFDFVGNYLPTASGDFMLEVDIPRDELVFMDWSHLLELDEEGEMISEEDSLYEEDVIENLHLEKPEENSDELICFFPILRLKECKRFLVVTDNWDSEEQEFGNVPQLNVNKLGVFN